MLLRPNWTKVYKIHRALLKIKEPHVTTLKDKASQCDRVVRCGKYFVPVRVYPKASNRVIVYFHGGGWTTDNINTYNSTCKTLSHKTNSTVVSVDYSLSPENKFPKATEECYAVTQSVLKKAKQDGKSVTLMGDSAGGNLSAVVSSMCRDRGTLMPDSQILLYPVTYYNYTPNSPFNSVRENGMDYILTSKRMSEYVSLYASSQKDFTNPYFSPLCAKRFDSLPDTLVVTAQYDPLRDEGEYYAKKLKEANNYVKVYRMKNVIHGFFVNDRKANSYTCTLINNFFSNI